MTNAETRRLRISFDTGGTFTDVVALDPETGRTVFEKELSTPEDPAAAILAAVDRAVLRLGASMEQVARVLGATTLVTNALIARQGARTALVTTRGFEDVLDMRREYRYDIYDLELPLPEPYVPHTSRFGVQERIDKDGCVITPLDWTDVSRVTQELSEGDYASVAISFIHSYVNPSHEREVAETIRKQLPGVAVTVSSDVSPEIREYERTSTAVINAYAQPIMARHVRSLERLLTERGLRGDFYIMLSSGRLRSKEFAASFPAYGVESGPAAGAILAAYVGRRTQAAGVVSLDMGGTTAKICVMPNCVPRISRSFEVARAARFKRGSGHPLRLPSVELLEIGAGGGSIAHVDHLGLLKVGPNSAGAVPGPACYGRGGQDPTVTDANLLLGYLDESDFLAGSMALDRSAAEAAVSRLATQTGMEPIEVAWGIHEVANQHMSRAAMVHVAELGVDPRPLPLVAFGGAGPTHAWRVARKLGIDRVICPPAAGVASAIGLLVAPPGVDRVLSRPTRLESLDQVTLAAQFDEIDREAVADLSEMGLADEDIQREVYADIRYAGQGHEVEVRVPHDPRAADWLVRVTEAFESRYEELHGRSLPGMPLEVVDWRFAFSSRQPADLWWWSAPSGEPQAPRKRRVYFGDSGGWLSAAVYRREGLAPGDNFAGPAVIAETESTIVIPPQATCQVDAMGNVLILTRGTEQ